MKNFLFLFFGSVIMTTFLLILGKAFNIEIRSPYDFFLFVVVSLGLGFFLTWKNSR